METMALSIVSQIVDGWRAIKDARARKSAVLKRLRMEAEFNVQLLRVLNGSGLKSTDPQRLAGALALRSEAMRAALEFWHTDDGFDDAALLPKLADAFRWGGKRVPALESDDDTVEPESLIRSVVVRTEVLHALARVPPEARGCVYSKARFDNLRRGNTAILSWARQASASSD